MLLVQSFYRTRGNTAAKTAVGTNDTIFTQNYNAYGDSGNQFVSLGYQENKVGTNSGNAISLVTTFNAQHPGSQFTVAGYDDVYVSTGNVYVSTGDLNVNTGNVNAQGSGSFNSPANSVNTLRLVTNNKSNMNLIRLERYGDTANLGGIGTFNMYRTGGTQAAPAAVANGDIIYNLTTSVYGDSGNIFVDTGGFDIRVGTNYGNGTVTTVAEYNQGSGGTGSVSFNYDTINFNGNINYTKTFGSFTSNATQTSNGANTTNYMTLNNTEDANGISIASSTQITIARPGRYNLQFSAQVEKTDSGSDIMEIWLDKNGSPVANSATQITLQGNNAKSVAAWDFNVEAANVNDYFRLAWASPDTDVQLLAVPTANTISGVAVPSLIVNVNPVGA